MTQQQPRVPPVKWPELYTKVKDPNPGNRHGMIYFHSTTPGYKHKCNACKGLFVNLQEGLDHVCEIACKFRYDNHRPLPSISPFRALEPCPPGMLWLMVVTPLEEVSPPTPPVYKVPDRVERPIEPTQGGDEPTGSPDSSLDIPEGLPGYFGEVIIRFDEGIPQTTIGRIYLLMAETWRQIETMMQETRLNDIQLQAAHNRLRAIEETFTQWSSPG